MIIESSQVNYQSLQDQRESVAVSSRLSIGRQQANSSDLEYEARELESVQLYSRVTDGDRTKNYAQQRLAREVVSLEQSSYEPAQPDLRRSEGGNASVTFSQYRYVTESQSSLITSSGVITLDDGRSINFNLYVERGRETELAVEQTLNIQGRQLTDPLVLNFATDILSLDSNTFFFDLDSDGDQESIAALGAGSGYLVLDANQNGEVDDGSELFGPQTGSGFGELARYDSDGNRWIDEADPVFEQLRVWVDAGTENQRLATLSEVGVGAIYLGATGDRFDLVDGQGRILGQTKAAGIMLMENGEVRTVQELDLADQRGQAAMTDQDLQLSNADLRQASGFSEVAARLRELRERQERQLEAIGENSKFVSPLQQLIEKLEALRQRVMEQLKMTAEIEEAAVFAKTFNRDELTYQLVRSKLKS
ncbi:hypothetical protein BTA51_09080 [Hahella sp. CCB-MM4]|uniref:hypothetical protein n=1 Tax=Hahella sp. (strain CCB-MM4) TaxID=1926491 RepID=UPI000B9AB4B9|nr:hypothetical protein [Hahella sp. CCB-MM4]OZG73925.1 hypothetical protein BTA51_09080 [Hahella sp. CCB-MM4]